MGEITEIIVEILYSPSRGNRTVLIELKEILYWKKISLPKVVNAPVSFTCFVCGEKLTKKHFAGRRVNQPICRTCYPYVDEWIVVGFIRFDTRHGFGARVSD